MPRGEPQLEPQEPVNVPLAPDPVAVPLEPTVEAPGAVPYGARSPEAGGMREVLAMSSPKERRKFVLQLQRTAGNAAVCRWLGVVRERYAARHAAGEGPAVPEDLVELEALIAGAGDEDDAPEGGPRAR